MGDTTAIVYCAGVRFDEIRGTDYHLASALSRLVPVIWVDPPESVVRAVRSRGWRAALGPVVEQVDEHLVRVKCVGPPWPTRSVTRPFTNLAIRAAIRQAVKRTGNRVTAMVVSSPQPRFAALRGVRRVYYATDDFVAGAGLMGINEATLRKDLQTQLVQADLAIAVSPTLADRWPPTHADIAILPNGCDADLGRKVADAPRAPDVTLPAPVVGVVGQLTGRLDIDILEAVAANGLSLLMVGPLDPNFAPERVRALVARDNVQWVGAKPASALPAYFRCMNVGITPYTGTAFNKASMPLKSLEYVAAGLGVVSTPLPAVDLLETSLIRTAAGPAEFVQAIRSVVATSSGEGNRNAREAFLRTHSWAARATTMLQLIGDAHDAK